MWPHAIRFSALVLFFATAATAAAQPNARELTPNDAVRLHAFAMIQEMGTAFDSSDVRGMAALAARFEALDREKQALYDAAWSGATGPAALAAGRTARPEAGDPYAALLSPDGEVGLAWYVEMQAADSPAMADLVTQEGGDPAAIPTTTSFLLTRTNGRWEARELFHVTYVYLGAEEAERSAFDETLESTGYAQWLRAERNPCFWSELATR